MLADHFEILQKEGLGENMQPKDDDRYLRPPRKLFPILTHNTS